VSQAFSSKMSIVGVCLSFHRTTSFSCFRETL
jgi:hypothetical protein